MDPQPKTGAGTPIAQLYGFMYTQMVATFAELGLGEALRGGTRTLDDLATRCGADPAALRRLLRALAAEGVVTEDPPGSFRLGPEGEVLTAEGAGLLELARYVGAETYEAWGSLTDAVRSGRPAFDQRFGVGHFAWLAQDPARAERFDRAMAETVASRIAPLLDRSWSAGSTVVDVGGGNGRVLGDLLDRHRNIKGILFDLPHVAERAGEVLAGYRLGDRVAVVSGDVFHGVPAGHDVYLLAQVLHDWDDEHAVAILEACRRAVRPGGRILVLEAVIGLGNAADVARLDLNMLVMLGGEERTLPGWEALASAAGLYVVGVAAGLRASLLELAAVPGNA